VLERVGPGVTEVALHPGYAVGALDSYQAQREEEMRVLLGEEMRAALRSSRLRFVTFQELAEGVKGA